MGCSHEKDINHHKPLDTAAHADQQMAINVEPHN